MSTPTTRGTKFQQMQALVEAQKTKLFVILVQGKDVIKLCKSADKFSQNLFQLYRKYDANDVHTLRFIPGQEELQVVDLQDVLRERQEKIAAERQQLEQGYEQKGGPIFGDEKEKHDQEQDTEPHNTHGCCQAHLAAKRLHKNDDLELQPPTKKQKIQAHCNDEDTVAE